MKNTPKKIYLQVDPDEQADNFDDFNKMYGVTWCADKINKNDIEYIRADLYDLTADIDSLHIDFAVYLTGHDQETIEQMYNDWRNYR